MKHIKRLTLENYDDISKLSQFAFQYSLDEERVEKKKEEAKRHQIWGYLVDGNLASKLHVIPLHVHINRKKFKMGGVCSVATWPEYRRQGIAKKLLFHALKEMKKNGQTISFLHPFHVGFYRKYGWELGFVNQHLTLPIHNLREKWGGRGYIRRTHQNIELLQTIYTQFALQYNGMLVRDEKWWKQRVLTDKDAQIGIAYNEADEAEGYIIYKVKDDVLTVQEITCSSLNGKKLLYEFIANHDSMAKEVKMKVPENDMLPYTLTDPFIQQQLEPYFMVRIVDVDAFLKQYPFKETDGDLFLQIEDDFFPENSGNYRIKNQNGKVIVTKSMDAKNENESIQCSIQQLTAICLGFKRPQELATHQLIKGKEVDLEKMEAMIPRRQTFFTDFF